MKTLCSLVLALSLVACAPLHHHDSVAGDVGEVAFRVIAFPLTLGMSELILGMEHERLRQQEQYGRWVQTLTPQQQYELEMARMQAAGQAMIGYGLMGGIMRPLPNQVPLYGPAQQPCIAAGVGTSFYQNCY